MLLTPVLTATYKAIILREEQEPEHGGEGHDHGRISDCTGELISSYHDVEMSSGVLISISFCSISVCLGADVITLLPGALEACFPDTGFATPICLSVASQCPPGLSLEEVLGVFSLSVCIRLFCPRSPGQLSWLASGHPLPLILLLAEVSTEHIVRTRGLGQLDQPQG